MPRCRIKQFTCDYETTTNENDCRVWAWDCCNIDSLEIASRGIDVNSFISWMFSGYKHKLLYFHNAKFDCDFLIYALFQIGFVWVPGKKELKNKTFTTLIADTGQFYTMDIQYNNYSIEIRDSLKLLPFSVDVIAKSFKLSEQKLEIDYTMERPKGYQPTEKEWTYIDHDVIIMAKALKLIFEYGIDKLTIGSSAFSDYISRCGGKKAFRMIFPELDCDDFCRKAYKGGFTMANPKYTNKVIGRGRVYDVNSLYPSVLHSPYLYPHGKPEYFTGKYTENKNYPLFIQRFVCVFKVKQNHIPTIQLKRNPLFIPTQYIETSDNMQIEMTLTSVDLELFFEHYDAWDIEYIDGYMFQAKSGLFDKYIDYWYDQKNKAKENENPALYVCSKLMLNNLYGKFSTNPNCRKVIPMIGTDSPVEYINGDDETRESIYVPVGAFCTSYGRAKTIRSAQANIENWLYSDTDSCHFRGDADPIGMDVDKYTLGLWDHEADFIQAKYLRAKLYMEKLKKPGADDSTAKWKVTGAGMTDSVKAQVTLDNFKEGACYGGKLRPKHVPGGTVLVETTFNIRGGKNENK